MYLKHSQHVLSPSRTASLPTMTYLMVLVVSVAVVMFAECCPTDSAVSEIEVLEWLDNPEASLRDLKQETEDLDWLVASPFAHFSDVRHSQVSQEEQNLAKLLPVNEQLPEQIPAGENTPEKEQNPEKAPLVPLVSQDQQKPERNPGQLPMEEKNFDQVTRQHHHASPTPPTLIQMEKRPDQGTVVLEQIPGAEQKPNEVPTPKEEPEKVPVVSWQVPVDEPQPEQVPVENKKPEQVFFEKEKPVIPSVQQQKSEQVVGTETSDKTQMDPVKKHMPSTTSPVSEHTYKPNRNSPIYFEDSGCYWSGTAPFCHGKCGMFYRSKVINKMGDGKTCLIGVKKLCCPISLTNLIG